MLNIGTGLSSGGIYQRAMSTARFMFVAMVMDTCWLLFWDVVLGVCAMGVLRSGQGRIRHITGHWMLSSCWLSRPCCACACAAREREYGSALPAAVIYKAAAAAGQQGMCHSCCGRSCASILVYRRPTTSGCRCGGEALLLRRGAAWPTPRHQP